MSFKKLTSEELVGCDISPQKRTFVIEYMKDWDKRRAAKVAGYNANQGDVMLEDEDVKQAILFVQNRRLAVADIDAIWLLGEFVDNHNIARAEKNLSASNIALSHIGKLNLVDAYAAEKVHIASGEEVAARLLRARKRNNQEKKED